MSFDYHTGTKTLDFPEVFARPLPDLVVKTHQARASRRPTQLTCSMNHQPFNNSFNVLTRGQAKPGHVVLLNG
jgi:hypothetical protein